MFVSNLPSDKCFLALSEYLTSPDVRQARLADHRAWILQAYVSGLMLFSGPQEPPLGGVLAFRAPNRQVAEDFVMTDPFVISGVSSYRLIEFRPTPFPWRSIDFEKFLSGLTLGE